MFGINPYILIAVGITFLGLSVSTWFFYDRYTAQIAQNAKLEGIISTQKDIIKNKDAQILLNKKTQEIQESIVLKNRIDLELKNLELKTLQDIIDNDKTSKDLAPESLRKLFEHLRKSR